MFFLARDLYRQRIAGYRVHAAAYPWLGMILMGVATAVVGPWRTSPMR